MGGGQWAVAVDRFKSHHGEIAGNSIHKRQQKEKNKNYRNDRNVSCVCMCVRASVLSSVYPDGNCYTKQAASCKCILTFIPRSAGHSLLRHTHTNALVVAGNYVFLMFFRLYSKKLLLLLLLLLLLACLAFNLCVLNEYELILQQQSVRTQKKKKNNRI